MSEGGFSHMQKVRRILALAFGSAAAAAILLFAGAPQSAPVQTLTPTLTSTTVASSSKVHTGEVLVGNVASAPKPAVSLGAANPTKYQWFACDDAVTTASNTLDDSCAQIPGAVEADLVLANEQVGKRVLFSMAVGSGPVTFSAATEAAVSPAPTLSATPLGISKTLTFVSATSTKLNSKITVARGLWPTGETGYALTYEWLRCLTPSESSLTAPANCSVITGAKSSSYTVTTRERGFYIVAHVTAARDGINNDIWTNAIGPVYKPIKYYKGATVAAGDGSYPYLSGRAVTANEGTWDGPPKFTYQWHVCSKAVPAAATLNAACKVITGATKDAFTPTTAQNGKYLMVRISGSTPLAKTIVTTFSASSGKVLDDPNNTKVLTLPASAPVVDDNVTLNPGVWTGLPTPALTFQWYLCETSQNSTDGELPAGCESIAGATSTTLKVTRAMFGKYLIALETAASSAGTDSILSEVSPAVVSRPVFENDPGVQGINEIDQVFTSTNGAGESSMVDTIEYQWLSCATASAATSTKPANCSPIAGATSEEYESNRSVEGLFIALEVTLVNEVGRTSKMSATSAEFIKSAPLLDSEIYAPTADPLVATALTVPSGLWRGAPSLEQSFQWLVCDTEGPKSESLPSDCSAIAGATKVTFTPTHEQAAKYLRVHVTATNSMGVYEVWSGTSTVVREKPSFIGLPILSSVALNGTAINLTETSSIGVPVPTRSISWYQCKNPVAANTTSVPTAAGCVLISGQTAAAYTPTNGDLEKYIAAFVTSTNSVGSASVFTATTSIIKGAPKLQNTVAAPGVAGTSPLVGVSVAAPNTIWVASPLPTKLYQWYSCADQISASSRDLSDICSEIVGETGSSFVPTVQEVDRYLMVRVGARNEVGSEFMYTGTSAVVLEAPNFISDPAIFGGNLTGETLTFEDLFTRGSLNPTVKYSWYRCTAPVTIVQATTTCQKVANETAVTYTLSALDLDKYISGGVTLTSSLGTVTKISLSSIKIQGPPVLSGVLAAPSAAQIRVGAAINMPANVWTGSPAVTKTQQWFACDLARSIPAPTIGSDCSIIAGATGATFTPTIAQVGKFLTLRVVATNDIATVTVFSPTTTSVNELPAFQGDISLSEGNLVGDIVTVNVPPLRGFPQPDVTYGWYRCPSAISFSSVDSPTLCERIVGADEATYKLDILDLDKFVAAGVRIANTSGAALKYSPSTISIQGVPRLSNTLGLPFSSLPNVAAPRIGTVQNAPTNVWVGSPKPNVSLQWVRCQDVSVLSSTVAVPCDDIPGATSATYTPVLADKAFALRVRFTATNSLGTTTIWSGTSQKTQQPPTFGADPTLNSFVSVGSLLSVNAVNQVAFPTAGQTYLWYRCTAQVAAASDTLPAAGCTLIDNETASTHTILSTDVDNYLVAKVTLTNAAGTASKFTASTGKVISKPVFEQEPQVGGQSYVTGTLVINPFNVSAKPAATLSYQWYVCPQVIRVSFSEVQDGCEVISGATTATYSPTTEMAGKFISVLVKASNLAGDVTSFSKTTSAILMPPRNLVAPVVSGVTKEGEQLTTDAGTWTPATGVLFSYKWYACSKPTLAADAISTTDCALQTGVTGKPEAVNLNSTHVGKYMVAAVTANNFTINVVKYSASTEIIASVPVYVSNMGVTYPAGQASTSGAPRVGYKIAAFEGTWNSIPGPSYVYQWFVCTNQRTLANKALGGDCRDINGATTQEFLITPELATDYNLVGKFLGVMVTGTNKAGQDFAYSTTSTKAVTLPPQVETPPEISGYRYVDGTLTGTKATFTGTLPLTVTQSWWQCNSAIETAVSVQPVGCTAVTGATAATLKLTLAMKGKFVTSASTALNDAGTLTVWAPSTVEVTTGAINVVPPTIGVSPTGLPKVGGTLTANHGVWSGDPALTESDYTYQWYSCSVEIKVASFTLDPMAECIRVGDAVNTTYEPVRDDAGRFVLVSVTGTNSQGGSKIYSTSTTKINMAPEVVVVPVQTGPAFVLQQQSASAGTWLGVPDPTFSYQWLICDSEQTASPAQKPADCAPIAGAVAATYTPIIGQVGQYLMMQVTATNVAGSSVAFSITSEAIKAAPVNLVAPAVVVTTGTTGLPVANQSTLTTTGGSWQGRPTPTLKFQWFSCAVALVASATEPAEDKDCKAVTELGDGIGYAPVPSDRGRFIAVKVVGSNIHADVPHWSATSAVINMAPVADLAPAVGGVIFAQGTVTAKADTWTAYPAPTRTFQWLACDEDTTPNACATVPGASAESFSIPVSLDGKKLIVKVTARNAFGSAVNYSPASPTITTGPVSTAAQVITGSVAYPPAAGAVLSTNDGNWAGNPRPTLTYQWYRCSEVIATSTFELNPKCVAIEGATSNTYGLVDADPSSSLMVGITGENIWGTSTRYSVSTAIVTEKVRLITSPSLLTNARIGQEITADEGVWRGFPKPSTVYSWYSCTTATPAAPVRIPAASGVGIVPPAGCTKITNAIKSTFEVSETHLGKMLIFMVTKSNTVNGTTTTINAYSQSSLPAAQPPVALAKPGISSVGAVTNANPKVGSVWTVSTGIWADPQPIKTYQWYRCDTRVATGTTPITSLPSPDCSPISGATGTSYTIVAEDSGKFISIEAIATNAADTIRQWSNSTQSVLQVPIAITPPSVSGDRQRGKTLTVDPGIWTGSPIPVISYQWYSCKTAIATTSTTPQPTTNCSQISGETTSTYVQSPAGSDDGKFITATVSGTSGTAEPTVYWVAVATGDATAQAPLAQALPSIYSKSGTAAVGEVFSIEDDRWIGAPTPTLTYKWYACDTANIPAASTLAPTCTLIAGQTGQTYTATVELADSKKYLMGSVTATNLAGTATTYSKSYGTTIDKGIINTKPATITATSLVVPTSVAWTSGEWTSSNELRITHKWLYCPTALSTVYSYIPVECEILESIVETNPASPTPLQVLAASELSGQHIALYEKVEQKIDTTWRRVRERVTSTTGQLTEAPSLRNANPGFVPPAVSKDMVVGYPTTAVTGTWVSALAAETSYTWRGAKVGTFTYQWFKCSANQASYSTTALPAGCDYITTSPGRSTTTATLTPIESEIGSFLGVRIRATNATGSFDVWTNTSLAVTQEATNINTPVLGTQNIVGERLTLAGGLLSDWKGSPNPTVTVEWYTCSTQHSTPPTTLPGTCKVFVNGTGTPDEGLTLQVDKSTGTQYMMAKVSATNKPWVFENRSKTVELFTATSKRIISKPYIDTTQLTPYPALSGSDDIGSATGRAVSAGKWAGTAPITSIGRWFACDTPVPASTLENVADGCVLFRSGQQNVALTHAQVGKYIVGQIESSNQAGKSWQSSAAGQKVLEPPTVVSPPEVSLVGSPLPSGRIEMGQTLSYAPAEWDGLPTPNKSVKFYECTSPVPAATTAIPGTCTASVGVTGTEINLGDAQVGKYIIAVSTASNTIYSGVKTVISVSASIGPVYRTPYFDAASVPTISAPKDHVGQTFLFTKSTVKGYEAPTSSYAWYICESQTSTPVTVVPAGCAYVSGADDAPFKVPASAAGKYILGMQTASATWTSDVAKKSSVSSTQITASPYVLTPPTTSGDDYVGGSVKISVNKGIWSSFPAITDDSKYSISILQCNSPSAAGVANATCSATPLSTFTAAAAVDFTLTSAQAGKYLVARVTATAATKLSATDAISYNAASFGPIREAPSIPLNPTIDDGGAPNVGKTVPLTPTTPKGYPVNTPTYDWYICASSSATVPASVPADCVLQPTASSKSFQIPASAAGKYLLGWVTATNELGSASKATAYSQMVKMAPVNVVAPSLSGVDEVGSAITVNPGDWTSTPAPAFSYIWYSCVATTSTVANGGCTAIGGSTTSSTFTPTEAQAGRYILANVTATTAVWGTPATAIKASQTFGPIRMPAEFKSVANVSGTAHVGETLALAFPAGSIVGYPNPTRTYEWYMCDSAVSVSGPTVPADCALVPDSSSIPVTLTSAHAGKFAIAYITASNYSSVSRTTKSTVAISSSLVNVSPPELSGDLYVGGANVSAGPGTWSSTPAVNPATDLAYSFFTCPTTTWSLTCTAIATTNNAKSVALTSAMQGKYVIARVTATVAVNKPPLGTVTISTNAIGPVEAAPTFTTAPTVTGIMHVGVTLSALISGELGVPAPTKSYDWYFCPSAVAAGLAAMPADCVAADSSINGSETLVLPSAAGGKHVSVLVSIENARGKKSVTTASVGLVTATPISVSAPVLAGDDVSATGKNITVTAGTWLTAPANLVPTVTYSWYACPTESSPLGSCTYLQDTKTGTLATSDAMVGKFVLARVNYSVTVNKPGSGSAVAYSNTSKVIRKSAAFTTTPTVSGYMHVGETVTAGTGNPSGVPTPSLSYAWYVCTSQVTASVTTATAPAGCVLNNSSTTANFVIPSSAAGSFILAIAKATSDQDLATVYRSSTATVAVSSAPVIGATKPAITGTAVLGSTPLTASTGAWTWKPSTAAATYSYKWFACSSAQSFTGGDTLPNDCTQIANQTAGSLTLTTAQLGAKILAEVTVSVATNQPVASKSTYYTGYTAVVMQKPAPGATPPSIGYTSLTAGSALKAILGTWTGSPAPTLQYTWYTCPAATPQPTNKLAPATCTERSKNADLTVLAEYKGLKILLLVLASNGAGTATNVSTFVTIP